VPGWLYALLVFAPLAVVGHALGAPDLFVFVSACLGLIPLAGLIGHATGQVAAHLGPHAGGLLNATFGNAAELIITLLALNEGLFVLVKASITGSIIGNTLLVLGMALLAGGFRNGLMTYDARMTSLNSTLMLLAVAGLLLPSVFGILTQENPALLEDVSVPVSAILLVCYAAYLLFVARGPGPFGAQPKLRARDEAPTVATVSAPEWSLQRGLLALAAATVGTAIVSEALVGAVEPVTRQFGLSELFVGIVLIPIVGNAAENWAAVRAAWRNHLDLTLSITAGSSTQIPLFVAPVLVFVSLAMARPMTLVFSPLELLVLALSALIFAYISSDGESHWLEGVLLLALYLMTAVVFFWYPEPVSA
jgi:Ca2+:H+ antiporter